MSVQRDEFEKIEVDQAEWIGHGSKDGHRIIRITLRKGRRKAYIGLNVVGAVNVVKSLLDRVPWVLEGLTEKEIE